MNTELAGGCHHFFVIIYKDDFIWSQTESFASQLEDTWIGLGQSHLMGVDNEVTHFTEMIMLLLLFPRADKAIADDGSLIFRAQSPEVSHKFHIERAKIFAPKIAHEFIDQSFAHPHDLSNTLMNLRDGDRSDTASIPNLAETLIQFAWFQIEFLFPFLSNPRSGVISSTPPMSKTIARMAMDDFLFCEIKMQVKFNVLGL